MNNRNLSLVTLLCLVANLGHADTLKLKNGQVREGKVISQNDAGVRFQVGPEITNYATAEVRSVTIGSAAAAPAAAAQNAPASAGGTIPAGTILNVRLKEEITSKHPVGYKFTCALEEDLKAGDAIIAAVGTPVYGVIVDAKQQGLVGKSGLAITLTGIRINGTIVPLTTDFLAGSGDPKVKSAARTAAAGAAIGAAAGGGGGAAKGAAIGAAVSTLKRQTVGIPANSLMEFKLTQPFNAK